MSGEPIAIDGTGESLPGNRPLEGTDLEINYNLNADGSLTLRVNKGGILVFRCKLDDAAKDISGAALVAFSTFAPDFVFKIGDSQDGMRRLMRSVGAVETLSTNVVGNG